VTSRVGEVVAPVEITDGIREGVVSLPHGFGHDLDGIALRVAQARPGVNSNLLADEEAIDHCRQTRSSTASPFVWRDSDFA
jgi:anaerobic selenocysteine-containing dehydrogenase